MRHARFGFLGIALSCAVTVISLSPSYAEESASPLVINEFMPYPNTGEPEWVELFNTGSEPIDIQGYSIDDETTSSGVTTLTQSTIIEPHTLFVVVFSSSFLNNSGSDSVKLYAPDGSLISNVPYSNASQNKSYSRIPDGTGDFVKGGATQSTWNVSLSPTNTPTSTPTEDPTTIPTIDTATEAPVEVPAHSSTITPTTTMTSISPTSTPTPTITTTNTPTPYPTGMYVNEFMAAPASGGKEWVEIYNSGSTDVDLGGWRIDDGDGGGVAVKISDGSMVPAQGYLVVEWDTSLLNNDGDTLQILYPDGTVADQITFGKASNGASFSRAEDGTWYMSLDSTPGAVNKPQATPTYSPTSQPISPTATSTPTPTRTPSPTKAPTATHTPSPTKAPTRTRTPSPTKAPTSTRTPSPTKAPTRTRTPSPTKAPTRTRTPSPTRTAQSAPTVAQAGVVELRISEVLAAPKTVFRTEWVEIINTGSEAVSLDALRIDDAEGGSAPVAIPAGMLVEAGGVAVVELPKAMFNNNGDIARLLLPDGSAVDQVMVPASDSDISACLLPDGTWFDRCEPTAGAANQPLATTNAATSLPEQRPAQQATTTPTSTPPASGEVRLSLSSAQQRVSPPAGAHPHSDAIYANATPGSVYNGAVVLPTTTIAPTRTPRPATRHVTPPQSSPLPLWPMGIMIVGCGIGASWFVGRAKSPEDTPHDDEDHTTNPSAP